MKRIFIILISIIIICLTGLGVIGYFVEKNLDENQDKNEEQINGETTQWVVLDGDTLDINKIEGYTPGGKVVENTTENNTNGENPSNINTNNETNSNNSTNDSTNNNTNNNTNRPGDTNTGNTAPPGSDDTNNNSGGNTSQETPETPGTPEIPEAETPPADNTVGENSRIRAVTASTFTTDRKDSIIEVESINTELEAINTKKNTDSSSSEKNETDDSKEEKSTVTEVGGLKLPFTPPYKEMEIISIGSYSGKFMEDGSDAKKGNVLAMVIKNTSDKVIDYGEIILKISGQNEALSFKISNLKPGTAAVVLESTGEVAFNENEKYIYLDSKNDMVDEMPLMTDEIKITTKDKEITVENISDKNLNTVYVYYKTVSPGGCYLGGITYRTKFVKLNKGKSESAETLHFSKGNSEILKVESVKE